MGRVLLAGLPDDTLDEWLARAPTRPLTPHTVHEKGSLRAEILRARDQGYALVLQEIEVGLCSIAVPLRDRQGRTLAALNVGMPFGQGVRERALKEILPALREAGQAIENAIGAVAPAVEG
jgi:IclR family pca regulon transcriptional regulator